MIILVLADNDERVTEHLSFSNIEFRRLANLYAHSCQHPSSLIATKDKHKN